MSDQACTKKPISVNMCSQESVCKKADNEFTSLMQSANKKQVCDKILILDETSDFQESQIEKKLKKKQENPVFTCMVCQTDLTHLNLEERSVHINECIDGQSSAVISSQEIGTENVFILDCPLCFKHFPAPELRCTHIKKCGKSRGLSTQSVIQAIHLQEKHVLERRALGLPLNNKPAKQPKKPTMKKFLMKPKSALESDIHLAKALSLSLKEREGGSQTNFSSISGGIPTAVLQAPAEFQNPGRFIPKKHTQKPTPVLLLRTEEERQKILLENVNTIIASVSEPKNGIEIFDEQSTYSQQTAFLWNLSKKAESNKTYYVEQLLDWISPSDVEVGSKLCCLSQIPGHHISTQHPCDYTFSCTEKSDANISMAENKSPPSLLNSLQSLVGDSWMSDVDIFIDKGVIVPAHKLLLALRYPVLKNNLKEPTVNGRHALHWENTSLDAALLFLNFIYTGSAEWREDTIDELHKLALRYEVSDLLNILNSNEEALEVLTNGMTQITPTSSFTDVEISNKEMNQVQNFVKNNQILLRNDALNIEDLSSQRSNKIDSSFVPGPVDGIYIQETNVANIKPNNSSENADVCILNEDKDIHIVKKNRKFGSNFDASNTDSNSSNDSCKILKSNISSEFQKSFDTFQEEEIKAVSPVKLSILNNEVYECMNAAAMSSPSKTLQENIDFANSSSHSFERTIYLKNVSPYRKAQYTPTKNIFEENISPVTTPSSMLRNLCMKNEISPKNQSDLKFESFENRCNFSRNLKNDMCVSNLDEAVIVLDNEQNNSKVEQNLVDKNIHRIFSPRKVSPGKNSKIPYTSSYNDCGSCTADLNSNLQSIQYGNTQWKGKELNSPKDTRICDKKELQILSEVHSLEALSKPNYHSKNLNSKKNIENSLNEDIYEINIVSSPEILVCDSDNEADPLLERNSFKDCKISNENQCNSDALEFILGKNYFKEHDKLSEKEIGPFTSIDKSNHSSMTEKINLHEIICYESDSIIRKDKTIESKLICTENNINVNVAKSDCYQHESAIQEHKFTPPETYKDYCKNEMDRNSPVVFDVIECHSDSNDDEIVSKKFKSLNNAKKIVLEDDVLNDDSMDDIPLLERIQNNKLKTSASKTFKDLLVASPDSPWAFQSSKYQQISEKDSNSFPATVCSSQQNSDAELKSLAEVKNFCASSPNGMNPKFKLSDSPITPLPDFKSMMTPQLKEALKKVGVKALPRKKAVAVLSHIYDETHPWNDDHPKNYPDLHLQSSSKNSDLKRNLSLPKKRKLATDISEQSSKKIVKSNTKMSKEKNEKPGNKFSKPSSSSNFKNLTELKQINSLENKMSSSESSTCSPNKSSNSRKNDVFNFSQSSEFSDCSQPESKDVSKLISEYISSNDELYKKVLTYMPLNLMELQNELEENGISVSVKKLTDFLDEQCITFTCPRKEEYKKKQQARTQRFRKRMIAKLSQQKNCNAT
ncbi:BTB domain-containing protein [Nephila pilipes]|uniref:Structure-specific endonuclease subunit SLX4 n=1 Tax=Nephila pilipes TaxID=299642 RepID=A0A8X6N581_NEPPI|nr:BTB domain-containing protein [Nephila pilipes]